jgi:hypothetical protein
MELNLTAEEFELLREMLDNYLSDLRMEIADTDRAPYRDRLKEHKLAIENILAKIPAVIR